MILKSNFYIFYLCTGGNCEEKSIILPEKKKNFIKIELNTYYAKTCLNCGYTEFYSAKIVDDETEKKCKDNAEPEGSY